MPKKDRTSAPISDDLLLAAIERAICHGGHDHATESLSTIKEHLGLPHHGGTTLQLRPKLAELEDAGLIEQSRRNSSTVWGLTTKGRGRLDGVRGQVTLPEAPSTKHGARRTPQPASASPGSAATCEAHWTRPSACLKPTPTQTRPAGSSSASACIRQVGGSHQRSTAFASGSSQTIPNETATTTLPTDSAPDGTRTDGTASSGSDHAVAERHMCDVDRSASVYISDTYLRIGTNNVEPVGDPSLVPEWISACSGAIAVAAALAPHLKNASGRVIYSHSGTLQGCSSPH